MTDQPTTRNQLIEQAARVVVHQIHGDHREPGPHTTGIARALADAGLLADPEQHAELEQIEDALAEFQVYDTDGPVPNVPLPEQVRVLHSEWKDAVAERDLALWLHAEALWQRDLARELLADVTERFDAERDALQARLDCLGFEIENATLPVGTLKEMSDAVNLVHPVSEEDDDVPFTELRARRAMEVVYGWLRTIRAIPAALQGDQPADLCDGCDRTDAVVAASDDGRGQFCPLCLPVANGLVESEPEKPNREPCPEGWHYIGQRLTHCAECGLPPWEHAGRATLPDQASPFGGGGWVLKPWRPGEAEKFRARVLGETAEPDVTPPDPSGHITDHGPVQPFRPNDHAETP